MWAIALLLGCTGDGLADVAWLSEPDWRGSERGATTGLGIGDVNGDGWDDLVVTTGNDIAPGPLTVHLGDGGPFPEQPSLTSEATAFHGHLALGDVDGDGVLEIAVSRYLGPDGDGPGGVTLWDVHDGLLAEVWRFDGVHSFGVALGDLDADGDVDLALATGSTRPGASPTPDLAFLNDGGLPASPSWQSEDPSISLDVALWSGPVAGLEDRPRLVFARVGSPHARYDALATSPSWTAPGTSFGGNRIALTDLDADGQDDLVVSETSALVSRGVVRAWCGHQLRLCLESDGPSDWAGLAAVDLNGDGQSELVAGQWFGPLVVMDRTGATVWESEWTGTTEAVAVRAAGAAGARPEVYWTDWSDEAGPLGALR